MTSSPTPTERPTLGPSDRVAPGKEGQDEDQSDKVSVVLLVTSQRVRRGRHWIEIQHRRPDEMRSSTPVPSAADSIVPPKSCIVVSNA
jgi:hypothetical protein